MTDIERIKNFTECQDYEDCPECPLFNNGQTNCGSKSINLAKRVVIKLESDNEKLRKIINILCDTISQLIE